MIEVVIPTNPKFKEIEAEIKGLYERSQDKICDTNSFEFIRDNTFLYTFLSDNKVIGGIYYFLDGGKLFLNGFAIRKNLKDNLYCLKLSTTWFNCKIYAEAQNRASAYCLLKCGFRRLDGNLFVFDNV